MIQPAPRDDEHLAKNVVGRCHVRSTPRVSQHRRGVLREEQLNPRPPIGLRNPHTDTMSAAAYEITPGRGIHSRSIPQRTAIAIPVGGSPLLTSPFEKGDDGCAVAFDASR